MNFKKSCGRPFTAHFFLVIFIWSLNAQVESRENWTGGLYISHVMSLSVAWRTSKFSKVFIFIPIGAFIKQMKITESSQKLY